MNQPDMFIEPQPREIIAAGAELGNTITRLESRGAFISRMEAPKRGRADYTLTLHWPGTTNHSNN